MADATQASGFGLYLHWPWCVTKCPYCDFNSHVLGGLDHKAWEAAYVAEIRRVAQETPQRILQSLYFGGGTPSLMAPTTVARVIDAARAAWPTVNDLEITLEANPGSVESAKFQAYAEAGVNRVSLGVQALNDRDLVRLGRQHTAADAVRALEIARETFRRVSFDLIYARQDQSRAEWAAELKSALQFAPDHLSLYQLTIEDGTVFGRRFAAGQLPGLPDEDLSADMYLETRDLCASVGLLDYEVSNYAKSGQESRHNLIYWRGHDYVGIGPGAHGRITLGSARFATFCPKEPALWLAAVRSGRSGEAARESLTRTDRAEEFLLMGLRLSEGIDLARYLDLAGSPLDPDRVLHLESLGVVEQSEGRLRATIQGRMVLNRVLADLIA